MDYSGVVDANDALMVLKYAAQLQEFSSVQIFLGDVDGDNDVDSTDADIILKKAADLNRLMNETI